MWNMFQWFHYHHSLAKKRPPQKSAHPYFWPNSCILKINLCQLFFRATLKVRLDSCLSLLLKWTTSHQNECTFQKIHSLSMEGLIHKWKQALLAPPQLPSQNFRCTLRAGWPLKIKPLPPLLNSYLRPDWSELRMEFERRTASSTMHIWGKKLRAILHRSLFHETVSHCQTFNGVPMVSTLERFHCT